ncbi:MAG: beta-propeller domain-containing protein [Desulfosalsimonadaceae bacterium]|nr:beta-propeller domain-containing protein [Desulfosalsimonadaceae bacterium]
MNRRLTCPLLRLTMRQVHPVGFAPALVLMLSTLALIFGCAGGTDIGNPEGNFSSDAGLKSYLVDQYAQSALPESLKTDAMDGISQPVTDNPKYADLADYSETSVREPGLNESDKVKTDGTYLYVAGASAVHVVEAGTTTGLREAARIPVNGSVDSLYLYGPALVILYTPENGAGDFWAGSDETAAPTGIGVPEWLPVNSRIGILTVDIRNPENPAIQKDFQAEGSLVDSRLNNHVLHVVTQFLPDLPPLELWHDGTQAAKNQTAQDNRQLLDSMSLDDFIPAVTVYDADGQIIHRGRLVDTENFLKPENPGGGSVVAVITLDLADLSGDFAGVGFICDVHHIYASTNSLYLIATRYDDINSEFAATGDSPFQTIIHRMDLSGENVTYAASGDVPGQVVNSFSMSEYGGVLRIAATTGYVWDGSAQNHVYCLQQQNNALAIIGRLENLASGERVTAARFIGNQGFLATSAQTGPLLTLDLSIPETPAVAGELKPLGVVAAIYPIDGQRLLTIGKATAADGDAVWYQGVQMSLFDVSDITAPKLLDTRTIGDRGTESEALYNYKAFTFQPEKNLLALPVALFEHQAPAISPSDTGMPTYNGLYVYEITGGKTFQDRGRIPVMADAMGITGDAEWLRGVFMDNRVVAVSPDAVIAAELPGLTEPFDSVTLLE